MKKSSNAAILVLVALGAALAVFADCDATLIVMKNPRIDQVIVCVPKRPKVSKAR